MRRPLAALITVLLAVTGLTVTGLPALTAPAQAGSAGSDGRFLATNYNITPYTMKLVRSWSQYGFGSPPVDLSPGQGVEYEMGGSVPVGGGGFCPNDFRTYYNGYMTYEVDVIPVGGGATTTEYMTIYILGNRSYSDTGCFGYFPQGNAYPGIAVINSANLPPDGWNPAVNNPGWVVQPVPSSQLTYQHNVPSLFDQTFSVAGNWTVDARSPLGAGFSQALDSICGSDPSSCDFTQTGPLTWTDGSPTVAGADHNCAAAGTPGNNYLEVSYKTEQEATLSVGGSVEASTELNLFNVIKTKITVGIEAEKEWGAASAFTKKLRVYAPPQYLTQVWAAPSVGAVSGTLKLTTPGATFTVTNFSQVRSGVSSGDLSPAYDVTVVVREMTADELQEFCAGITPTGKAGGSAKATKTATLVVGRGIGKVRLGQPRDAAVLGTPVLKAPRANRSAVANDCTAIDPRCTMVAARGGSWAYADTSVLFGADRRVSGLIYRGAARTAKGVGVGSTLRRVRAAYPAASCQAYSRSTICSLEGADAAVQTTFHLTRKKGRTVVDRVMIYRVDTSRAGWTA